MDPLESNLGLVSRPRMFGMETGAHRDQTTATAMRCKRSQESWWVSSKWEEHVINIKVSGATVSRNTIANTLHRNGLKSCRSASNNLIDSFIPLQQSNLQLQFIQAASSAAEMQELHYLWKSHLHGFPHFKYPAEPRVFAASYKNSYFPL